MCLSVWSGSCCSSGDGALRSGAAGYLLKDTPPADIVRVIELVHAGPALLSPTVPRRLIALTAVLDQRARRREQARRRLAALSRASGDVVGLLGAGRSNAQLAYELHPSVPTIQAHPLQLFGKLQAGRV